MELGVEITMERIQTNTSKIMMENKDKAISLFRYIMELYAQRYQVIADVKNQEWFKFLTDIPVDQDNIILNYVDRTDSDEESSSSQMVILKVRKPEFEPCPSMPKSLEKWMEDGWQRFYNAVLKREKHEVFRNGIKIEEKFSDSDVRIIEFDKWNKEREEWVLRQQKIDRTRRFFNELYLKYIDLDRDSEIIELMVGQGILECDINDYAKSYHPLLLKRVTMDFDSINNIISIIDTNVDPEIYTMLLQGISFINHASVKVLKEQLLEDFFHPLDRNETPDFLKSFAHRLHSESRYIENPDDNLGIYEKLIIYNNPVFFIRKRTGGVIKAIEEIINQIEETGEISGPLLNLIGENVSQLTDIAESLDLSERLAAISGEDKDILLSKEANREQLEIAKRIESYNAVLVQGPPGTGKTHTIANLVGHFLAQGKNILVTSHTKKALTVVKEKVASELQNLCVAVLEDNNKDMERSIDGITHYISSHTSLELDENAEKLKNKRLKILYDLAEVRRKIFSIKYKEFETITFGGKGFSPSEAARFVYEHRERLSFIPGKVVLYKPLPATIGELELLYKTNETISIKEENELTYKLPNPVELISPNDFKHLVTKYNELIDRLNEVSQKLPSTVKIDTIELTANVEGQSLCNNPNLEEINLLEKLIVSSNSRTDKFENWSLYAILDGKKGGGFKAVWENLISSINDAYQYASNTAELIIGKKVSGELIKDEDAANALKEMREHLSKGKKLSSINLLIHKEWYKIYSTIKINENNIDSVNDCDVLLATIQLSMKRKIIAQFWDELITKRGGTAFKDFGSEPEQICISRIAKIKESLEWYDVTYNEIKQKLDSSGFNIKLLGEHSEYTLPLDEITYLINLLYKNFPTYIEAAKILYFELPNKQNQINKCIDILTANDLNSSVVCQNIASALRNKCIEEYAVHYITLDKLYNKYFYLSERARILRNIELNAPDWANLIRNRIGIHGESQLPQNIEDAWKWKQFAEIIDEITAQPFEELQHQSVSLNSELRKVTAKLAENYAWYHLLCRIEGDIGKKQALQGWKLTEKKIGKGTGKTAPALRREAQKLMAKCQSAVPAWIMPVNKALESLDPTKNKFDIVIIDEASQSDISALAIMYLAKKIIIVGDDEQVSPSAVGIDVDKMANLAAMYIKGIIPNAHLYDMKSSLYDIAKTTFPTLMLKEHFRCVPSIIGYSNRLSYDYKIKPLRDDSNVPIKPATVPYRVSGTRNNRNKTNEVEARTIVSLMMACMEQKEYQDMTFGAISLLGDEQAKKINELAIEKINPMDYESRRILCGNASHFQGDERDVVFISLVDSNEGDGPLRMVGEGVGKSTKQRYNVAVSRAKNQVWVVHSLDVNNDLKPNDMRRDLIEYVTTPNEFKEQVKAIYAKADSPFEVAVAKALVSRGYNVVQQWEVGAYRIDMVAICGDKKIAIECDGELYHSGDEKIREDMERQTILERLGWRFIRIRGSEFYRNPAEAINRVINELTVYDIEPEQQYEELKSEDSELKQKVITSAARILDEWEKAELDEDNDEEIACSDL